MNAFEQLKSLAMITKVEAIVHSFKSQFTINLVDLKPWVDNEETKLFNDPNSIDIGFHFAKFNFACGCRSILMQVKIDRDFDQQNYKAIGIELSGFEAFQEQWRVTTIEYWEFSGKSQPTTESQEQLKQVCSQILQVFNHSQAACRE